jgi:hypothetical protein
MSSAKSFILVTKGKDYNTFNLIKNIRDDKFSKAHHSQKNKLDIFTPR